MQSAADPTAVDVDVKSTIRPRGQVRRVVRRSRDCLTADFSGRVRCSRRARRWTGCPGAVGPPGGGNLGQRVVGTAAFGDLVTAATFVPGRTSGVLAPRTTTSSAANGPRPLTGVPPLPRTVRVG